MSSRVLLCEDEKDAREILSFYLDTTFDEVVVAEDGEKGWKIYQDYLAKGKCFDLVLTDIKMPGMDGISMLEKINDLNKDQQFIIVSAYQDEEKLLKSIELRVLGYFVKPLNIDNVMALLRKAKEEVLSGKQQNIQLNKRYEYNPRELMLYENEKIVPLSRREIQVLDQLVRNRGKIVSIDDIKSEVWGSPETHDSTFRALIKRLKDKVAKDDFIISRKGLGYIIE